MYLLKTLGVALWWCFFCRIVTCVPVTLSLIMSDKMSGKFYVQSFSLQIAREHQERGKCIGGLGISSVIDLFRSTISSWLNSNCLSRKGKCICLSKKYPFLHDGRNAPTQKSNKRQEFLYSVPYTQNVCHVLGLGIFLTKGCMIF